MITSNNKTSEAEISALIENNIKAVRTKDIDGATAIYAPDVVLFDVVNPLQYIGSDALRERLNDWFSSFQGSIGYEMGDLNIIAGDDVAFSHSLNHVSATTIDGGTLDMWWRATICYRKIEGKWLITHGHTSVPFDSANGMASLGLKP